MHSQAGHQWMMVFLATGILGTMFYKDAFAGHGPVRVTKSSDENLRDRGTYIICFKDHVTEEL